MPGGTAGAQEAGDESTGYEPLQSQTTEKESTEPVTGYIMDGDEEEESTAQQDSNSEDTSSTEDGGSVLSENPLQRLFRIGLFRIVFIRAGLLRGDDLYAARYLARYLGVYL